jgi:hypothetical protein
MYGHLVVKGGLHLELRIIRYEAVDIMICKTGAWEILFEKAEAKNLVALSL